MLGKLAVILFVVVYLNREVSGHGYMLEPPNRSSLWRFDWTAPANYNDNEFFCGGVENQFSRNGGRCGICGDNWADPRPRNNENTGYYGRRGIQRVYSSGGIVQTSVTLTANHQGTFVFSLCVLSDPSRPEPENCFVDLTLADGSPVYNVDAAEYTVTNQVQLPVGVTCEHCVFRWHYTSGNSWGVCEDGTQGIGCGDQETFRSCADISIV